MSDREKEAEALLDKNTIWDASSPCRVCLDTGRVKNVIDHKQIYVVGCHECGFDGVHGQSRCMRCAGHEWNKAEHGLGRCKPVTNALAWLP